MWRLADPAQRASVEASYAACDDEAELATALAGVDRLGSDPGIAAELSQVIGADVAYVDQTVEECQATLESFEMPAELAAMVAAMDPAITDGGLYPERTYSCVLFGRPSTSFSQTFSA